MPARIRPGRVITIAAVAVLVVAALFFFFGVVYCELVKESGWCTFWPHFTTEVIEGYIRDSGPWGVAVSMGLMIIHSFIPFPGEVIAIANGMIYGVLWGTAITWTGAMMGAFLAFGLARKLGSGFVHRMLREKRALEVEEWSRRHGGGAVFVMRFVPVISFNLINYAAGLTKISWWTFAWATGLGILPITTLMVVMGAKMKTMPWYGWLALVGAGLLTWGAGHALYVRLYGGK